MSADVDVVGIDSGGVVCLPARQVSQVRRVDLADLSDDGVCDGDFGSVYLLPLWLESRVTVWLGANQSGHANHGF